MSERFLRTLDPMAEFNTARGWTLSSLHDQIPFRLRPQTRLGNFVIRCFAVFVLLTGCYVEPTPPSAFRYSCDVATDCDGDELCVQGLCLSACAPTAEDPTGGCPSQFQACMNGYCSSTCSIAREDSCSEPQQCLAIPFEDANRNLGVCGFPCVNAATDCKAGEVCFQGWCVSPDSAETGAEGQ